MSDSNLTTDPKFTTDEAALYLGGLKRNTLEIWRSTGKGPAYLKVGLLVRYAKSDLDAWLETRKFSNTSQYATHQVTPNPAGLPKKAKPLGPVQKKRADFMARQAAEQATSA